MLDTVLLHLFIRHLILPTTLCESNGYFAHFILFFILLILKMRYLRHREVSNLSKVTQLVPSRTRNCTQAIWSRVHTLNYHARLERGGEWEESGGMMIREWKKEQEAWEHKFLLSTFYIPGTVGRKMHKTVAHVL